MLETYLSLLELGYFEVTFVFEGLADEHVWKRPAGGLLSIGELAGHLAYSEMLRLTNEDGDHPPDLAKCQVRSPLIDYRFRYYPITLETPPSEEHRAMTAKQVCEELVRVHKESVVYFKAQNHDLASTVPGCPTEYTYGEALKYMAFHIAYHTGQMYSARHLLGEETPDN